MADSQVPWGLDAPAGAISDPAWRAKPSWYMITSEDRMIPLSAQRTMAARIGATTSEVTASHAVTCPGPKQWPPSSRRPQRARPTSKHAPAAVPTLTVTRRSARHGQGHAAGSNHHAEVATYARVRNQGLPPMRSVS
jgi:hypothetical protein